MGHGSMGDVVTDYNLYFENSRSVRRVLASYTDLPTEKDVLREATKMIHSFCEERDFKIIYTRLWNENGETVFDVGSHSEFFYLSPQVKLH